MRALIFFAVGTISTLSAMFGFWASSLGGYDGGSSSWLADVYDVKATAARSINGSKIVIISGSNAMFGIDSENLSEMLGVSVLNMASHAGLPLPLLVDLSIDHINSGDIVIAPLEFEYYRRDPAPSLFEATNVESWAPDYALSTLSRAITYFRSASMLRAARQVFAPMDPFDRKEEIRRAVDRNTSRGVSVWEGYSAKSLKANGDMLIDAPNVYRDEKRVYTSDYIRADAISDIVKFKTAVEDKGAKFVLTWPTTARSAAFDFRSTARAAGERLKRELHSYGLDISCDPTAFQFEPNLFLDTEYHLGLDGAEKRTIALVECLAGKHDAQDPNELAEKRRQQAREYDRSLD